jgi:hypothetical protein
MEPEMNNASVIINKGAKIIIKLNNEQLNIIKPQFADYICHTERNKMAFNYIVCSLIICSTLQLILCGLYDCFTLINDIIIVHILLLFVISYNIYKLTHEIENIRIHIKSLVNNSVIIENILKGKIIEKSVFDELINNNHIIICMPIIIDILMLSIMCITIMYSYENDKILICIFSTLFLIIICPFNIAMYEYNKSIRVRSKLNTEDYLIRFVTKYGIPNRM